MAPPKIELEVQFKQQRESLNQLRKDVEATLRSLKVSFDKDSLKQITDNPLSVRGAGKTREAIETQLSKKLGVLQNRLAERQSKAAETVAQLAAANERLASGNKEAASEAGRLTASLNKQKRSIDKLTEQEQELASTLALVDRLFKKAGSAATRMEFISAGNNKDVGAFKGVRARENAVVNTRIAPRTDEQKAAEDRAELENIQGNKARAKATADAVTYRRREAAEVKKQFETEQKITNAYNKRLDEAFKGVGGIAKYILAEQEKQLKEQQKQTESERKTTDAFYKRAEAAFRGVGGIAKYILAQQKEQQKQADAIKRQVDAAVAAADKAVAAGEKDRGEFFIRQLEKARKAQLAEQERQTKLEKRISSRLEAIDRRTADRLNRQGLGGGSGGGGGGPPSIGGGGGGGRGPDFSSFSKGLTTIEKIKAGLNASDKAAVDFGEAVRNAALRLGAWATPSVFMFKTLSLLRTAVDEVVALDRETRRLVFFQLTGQDGGLEKFNNTIKDSATKLGVSAQASKLLGDAFNNITSEATRAGLSVNEVILGANTVARIGQNAFDFKTGASTDFLKATLALTKLEGGLLSADRAAEILQASIAQFGLEAEDAVVVAAKLATVASSTSFGIEELGTVVTRFGSAALNIQNLTFDETLQLAAIAGKTLGTNASRAATALRQLTTKIAGNADEIERLTGIKVNVGDTGQLRGIQALFDVLKKVKELKLTGFGEQITKLIADRENESDAFALAGAIDKIDAAFTRLKSNNISDSQEQVTALLNQQALASRSTETSIKRLGVAFDNLANSVGVQKIIKTFNDGLTGVLNFTTSAVNEIKTVESAFKGLEAVGLLIAANFSKKIFAGIAGAVGSGATNELRAEVANQLSKPFSPANIKGPLESLTKGGFLTPQRADAISEDSVKVTKDLAATNIKLGAEQQKLNVLKQAMLRDISLELSTQQKINQLHQTRSQLLAKQAAISKEIANATSFGGTFKKGLRENAGTLLSAGALGINALFTDSIAGAFDKPKTQEAVKSGLNKALTGLAFGAEIGSLFGPKGAVVGAIAGGIIGTAVSIGSSVANGLRTAFLGVDSNETQRGLDIDKELENIKQRARAREFAKREAAQQTKIEREAAAKQGKIQLAIFDTDQRILRLREELKKNTEQNIHDESVLNKLGEEKEKRARLLSEVSKREEDILKRQVEYENEITALRTGREVRAIFFDVKKQLDKELADINNSRDKKAQILIDLEIDRAAAISEIKGLVTERVAILDEIKSVGDNEKDKQNRIRLENQLVENRKSELTKRATIINLDVEALKKIRDNARETAKEILDAFKNGISKLNDALKSSVDQTKRLLNTFTSLQDQFATANRFEKDNPRRGLLSPTQKKLTDEIKSFIKVLDSEVSTLGDRRKSIVSTGFAGQNDKGNLQVQKELQQSIGNTIANMKLLADAEKQAKDATDFEAQARVELLKNEIQQFGIRVERTREFFDEQTAAVEKLISVQQERFNEEKKLVDILRERAQKEAELGKSAITDPRQFLEGARDFLSARQLFAGLNTGKNLDKRLKTFDADKNNKLSQAELEKALPRLAQILDERIGKLGANSVAVLQRILKGIEFAKKVPGGGFGGLSPDLAEELVGRAVVNSGKGLEESVKKEQAQLSAVETARQEVLNTFQTLRQITVTRINFEKEIEKFEQQRVDVIKNQFANIQNIEMPAAFRDARDSANEFGDSLKNLKQKTEEATTTLDEFVSGISVNQFSKIFGKLAELLGRVEDGKGLGSGPKGVGGGGVTKISPLRISQDSIEQITDALKLAMAEAGPQFVNTLNTAKIGVSVPDIQVQLNANVRKELQGDEFILKLSEALREGGLEDRVEQIRDIVVKLAKLEVSRGSDIPIPE